MSDVEANRAGRITVGQRFKLLRGVASLLFLTGIGLVLSIAIGPNLIGAFIHFKEEYGNQSWH